MSDDNRTQFCIECGSLLDGTEYYLDTCDDCAEEDDDEEYDEEDDE